MEEVGSLKDGRKKEMVTEVVELKGYCKENKTKFAKQSDKWKRWREKRGGGR